MQFTLAAALLASSAMAAPAANDCTSKSMKLKDLSVSDFKTHSSWTYTTPSHLIANGDISFTLSNAAAVYKAQCKASGYRPNDFFYGETNYACKVADDKGDHKEEITFNYNGANHHIQINQTWACLGEGSHFEAIASTKLNLDCKEKKYENPHWKEGETFSSRVRDCKTKTNPAKVKIDNIAGAL